MLEINKPFTLKFGRLVPVAIFLALAAFPPQPAGAQGLLDRIESRVRSRIDAYRVAPPNADQAAPEQQPRDGRDLDPRENTAPRSNRAPASDQAPTFGIEARASTGLVAGVQVLRFFSHSQAEEAGLRPGDLVASVNGSPTPSIADIGRELSRHEIGDTVLLAVVRAGQLIQMEVPLVENLVSPKEQRSPQERRRYAPGDNARPRGWIPPVGPVPPVPQFIPRPFARPRPYDEPNSQTAEPANDVTARGDVVPRGGVDQPDRADSPPLPKPEPVPSGPPRNQPAQPEQETEALTTESPQVNPILGVQVTDDPDSRGATVRNVEPYSPAANAGLRADDRIVAVEGRVVRSSVDLRRQIDRFEPGRTVTLQTVRGGAFVEVDATLTKPSETTPENTPAASDDDPSPGPSSSESNGQSDANGQSKSDDQSASKNWAQSLGSAVGGLFSGSSTKSSENSSSQETAKQPPKADESPKESSANDPANDGAPAAEELPAPSASDP